MTTWMDGNDNDNLYTQPKQMQIDAKLCSKELSAHTHTFPYTRADYTLTEEEREPAHKKGR